MIKVENLSKNFGSQRVLDNINLEVSPGTIYGLMGPNGAGKTTLIKTMLGILQPSAGQVMIDGHKIHQTASIKSQVGYVADYQNYYASFSVADMINFYRHTYRGWDENRFLALSNLFQLPAAKKTKTLSKGMRTQLAILLNLSINPKVLLLDEPTSGLDPVIRRQVMQILLDEVAEKASTLFISTHSLDELERVCDKIGIIHQGSLLFSRSIDQLKEEVQKIQVAFSDQLPAEIANLPEILKVEQQGRVYNLVVKDKTEAVMAELKRYQPLLLETVDMSLEDIFIYQMGGLGYEFEQFNAQ